MGLDASLSLTNVHIRALHELDDIPAITDLLHRAYKPLADAGLRFMATHQDDDITRDRFANGHGFVAFTAAAPSEQPSSQPTPQAVGTLIGTITIYPTDIQSSCAWYKHEGVWHFGQFAVEPTLQGKGIGALMMDFAEHFARLRGAKELALDTAMPAHHLITYYMARGYREVDQVQWNETNYRSVILSKTLL